MALAALVIPLLALALGGPGEVHVSARTGDDTGGDGSVERPFRSLTRALDVARAEEGELPTLRLDMGRYGPASGERFPLDLSGGVRILGMGSGLAVLDGEGAGGAVLRVDRTQRPAVLSGVTIESAGIGLEVPALAPEAAGPRARSLVLEDVQVRTVSTGLVLRLGSDEAPSPITLRAGGLRAEECEVGIAVQGVGELDLRLHDGWFLGGRVGLFLETDPAEDVNEPRERGEALVTPVHHTIVVEGCRFLDHSEAGILRVGRNGANRGPAYTFRRCLFRGNKIGLELRRPCGDTPLRVDECEFVGNSHFGLRTTGFIGSAEVETVVADSLFRWNGVGLHLTSVQHPLHVRRCRILDNLGNGIYLANVLTAPSVAWVTDCLIAHNGAAGLYCMADNRLLTVHALRDTIVGNAATGIRDHRRHAGTSEHEVRGCIIAGHPVDLTDLDASYVQYCLVEDGGGAGSRGNLEGDPGFLSREERDYRLRADSPCVDAGPSEAEPRFGDRDVLGRPRGIGAPDLGAVERQPTDPR